MKAAILNEFGSPFTVGRLPDTTMGAGADMWTYYKLISVTIFPTLVTAILFQVLNFAV